MMNALKIFPPYPSEEKFPKDLFFRSRCRQ